MQMEIPILDYADGKTIRRSIYLLRLIPYFAVLFAIAAWRKSMQYHDYGQVWEDQQAIARLMVLSGLCVLGSVALLVWHRGYTGGRRLTTILLCIGTMLFNALAYWSACTATLGGKDRVFYRLF
jgi:hypothetical protein